MTYKISVLYIVIELIRDNIRQTSLNYHSILLIPNRNIGGDGHRGVFTGIWRLGSYGGKQGAQLLYYKYMGRENYHSWSCKQFFKKAFFHALLCVFFNFFVFYFFHDFFFFLSCFHRCCRLMVMLGRPISASPSFARGHCCRWQILTGRPVISENLADTLPHIVLSRAGKAPLI